MCPGGVTEPPASSPAGSWGERGALLPPSLAGGPGAKSSPAPGAAACGRAARARHGARLPHWKWWLRIVGLITHFGVLPHGLEPLTPRQTCACSPTHEVARSSGGRFTAGLPVLHQTLRSPPRSSPRALPGAGCRHPRKAAGSQGFVLIAAQRLQHPREGMHVHKLSILRAAASPRGAQRQQDLLRPHLSQRPRCLPSAEKSFS